jgi:hypothetical protein
MNKLSGSVRKIANRKKIIVEAKYKYNEGRVYGKSLSMYKTNQLFR